MKKLNILGFLACLLLLFGCFKDEGNYEYSELTEPTWLFDHLSQPLRITTYAGDTAKCQALFEFGADSAEILPHLRYEWRFRGVLLSEDRHFWMVTDSLIAKLNLPFSETTGSNGSYTIIDTRTGVKHMVRTWLTIRPKFYHGDWLILSEHNANSKLSFYKKKTRSGYIEYTLYDNLFEEVNGSPLMGQPRKLRYSQARDVSVPIGATSVITSQAAYLINNENFEVVQDYRDEFLDGTPSDFNISNIFHSRLLAYIATEDGRLFRRVLSDNWLGGRFLTEPYVIDAKGYKVTDFGFGKTAQTSQISPVYDELNRRVMMIQMRQPYRIMPTTTVPTASIPTPVWEMPEGTEILYLGASSHKTTVTNGPGLFTMVYNDESGNTRIADFMVEQANALVLEHANSADIPFPGGNMPVGTKFLGTADRYVPNYLFYTRGNELRYINRLNEGDNLYMSFDSEITDVKYAAYNINYKQIVLGFANGDFLMVDISAFEEPRIMPETKVNVGGKVVDIMEIRTDTFTDAY